MEKLLQKLVHQQQRHAYIERCIDEQQKRLSELYSQIIMWVEPFLRHTESPRVIHLSLEANTSLMIHLSCLGVPSLKSTKILLSLFDVETPKERTSCQLSWQVRSETWIITNLKRKDHFIKSICFRRRLKKHHLENWLIDFIRIPKK